MLKNGIMLKLKTKNITKKVFIVAGARPNFVKIAPLWFEIKKYKQFKPFIVHTGQHHDFLMSQIFFQDFKLSEPDFYLQSGSGTHAEQTSKVMIGFEKLLFKENPDIVILVGDVNSTLACALTSAKFRCLKSTGLQRNPLIVHIEAGLRSFDMNMPEEINRIFIDRISDLLFTPSIDANENLLKEGILKEKIFMTGNIMIDSLIANKALAMKSKILSKIGLMNLTGVCKEYAVLTLHRPSNVDNKKNLTEIIMALKKISHNIPIIYPVHPRAIKNLDIFGLLPPYFIHWDGNTINKNGLYITNPLGYIDFLSLETNAKFILTDSGGVQEESTVLGVPCFTLRDNTERPVTVTQGTNTIIGTNRKHILESAHTIMGGENFKKGRIPELWDGKTAERIVKVLIKKMSK